MSSTVQKIRANRKVMEQNCLICNAGFALAEEVYQCSSCGGHHHVACWDAVGACPQAALASSGPPTQSSVVEPAVWTSDTSAYPIVSDTEIKSTYSAWSTEQLEEALSTNRASYLPEALSLLEAEWRGRNQLPLRRCLGCQTVNKSTAAICVYCGLPLQTSPVTTAFTPTAQAVQTVASSPALAPDERRCPTCAEVIKKEAVKCRYCGHLFDSRYGAQARGGFFGDTERRMVEDQIRSDAKSALTMSIIGIFCLGIILEPIALYKSSHALNKLNSAEREYPSLDVGSARGQAIAARVIAICILVLSVLIIIARIGSSGSR